MLEYFVHLDNYDPPTDLVLAVAEVSDEVIRESVTVSELPANWRDGAAPPEFTRFGINLYRPARAAYSSYRLFSPQTRITA
jgi:hypothetical protein